MDNLDTATSDLLYVLLFICSFLLASRSLCLWSRPC